MLITHKQMWNRFRSIMKNQPSDFKICCPICNQEISDGEVGVEYSKTKRRTETFIHSNCAKKW